MKTHYQLLDLQPAASAEEIKRAFRREIARYHPDKVQHLGPEFQEIAATRAAELTEAYRVLMDADLRQQYDGLLAGENIPASPRGAATASRPETAAPSPPPPEPPAPAPPDLSFQQERTAVSDMVRKAIVAKLRNAVAAVAGDATSLPNPSFDVAYVINPKKGMFKKAEPAVRILARIVPQVDPEAIGEVWPLAAKGATADAVVCVLLLGNGLAAPRLLGGAVAEQRRKTRIAPVVIPVDIRDWEALFPPEAPDIVRRIIEKLRSSA